MIFLSHNSNDKPIVEQVALQLKNIYGQDNIFYDSWSIQPGEGIVDKMNEGMAKCRYFFFFVSANSLNSAMVKLEWQNALFKAAQNRIQFIPIRLDNSTMPILLTQSLYIDLFSKGLDVAVRQITDVINGNNTYREPIQSFSNIKAYKYREGNKIIIECRAEHYLEPISCFAFCTQHDISQIDVSIRHENMCNTNQMNNVTLANGHKTNIILRSIPKGTLPGFPFIAEFSSKNESLFDIDIVLHEKGHGEFGIIPLILGRSAS